MEGAVLEKVREGRQGRLRSLLNPARFVTPMHRAIAQGPGYADVNSIWQTQYSLVPLFELETDLALKSAIWKHCALMPESLSVTDRTASNCRSLCLPRTGHFFGERMRLIHPFNDLRDRCATLLAITPISLIDMPKSGALASSITHVGINYPAAADTYWTGRRNKIVAAPNQKD